MILKWTHRTKLRYFYSFASQFKLNLSYFFATKSTYKKLNKKK